jgi:hypothetical protein
MSAFDPKRTLLSRSTFWHTPMHRKEKGGKVELAEALFDYGSSGMCDYSLHNVTSRPAKVGDKLTTRDFGTGTRGFAASEDGNVAVCVRPGTELSFGREVTCQPIGILCGPDNVIKYKTAIFRQINIERVAANHDALEFPDGQILLLTCLREGQVATVLQLPAEPKTAVKVEAQRRARIRRLTLTFAFNSMATRPGVAI